MECLRFPYYHFRLSSIYNFRSNSGNYRPDNIILYKNNNFFNLDNFANEQYSEERVIKDSNKKNANYYLFLIYKLFIQFGIM